MSKFQVGDRVVVAKDARWQYGQRVFTRDLIGTVAQGKDDAGDYHIELDTRAYDPQSADDLKYLYAHEDSLRPLTIGETWRDTMSKTQGVWVHVATHAEDRRVTLYAEEIDALRAYAAEGVSGKVVFVPYGETLYL